MTAVKSHYKLRQNLGQVKELDSRKNVRQVFSQRFKVHSHIVLQFLVVQFYYPMLSSFSGC